MAFLNRTNHGFPAALIYLWKALLPESLERETLIRRCAPESIDQKHVTNTLKKWTEFGFFCEDGDYKLMEMEAFSPILQLFGDEWKHFRQAYVNFVVDKYCKENKEEQVNPDYILNTLIIVE